MIDMKLSKKEAEDKHEMGEYEQPEYPWGLCLELDETSLEKLGIESLPVVGAEFLLTAKVVVRSTSEHSVQGGEGRRNLSAQITEMELATPAKDQAKIMFGE